MEKTMKKLLLMITIILALFISLSSCVSEKTYDDGYFDGYEEGYNEGHLYAKDEYSEHSFDMYKEGYDEAYEDFLNDIVHDAAVFYAKEKGGWHPEEAMCIIDAYESGGMSYGQMPITEEDYKAAVHSLYYYYEYFYDFDPGDKIECGYENYD